MACLIGMSGGDNDEFRTMSWEQVEDADREKWGFGQSWGFRSGTRVRAGCGMCLEKACVLRDMVRQEHDKNMRYGAGEGGALVFAAGSKEFGICGLCCRFGRRSWVDETSGVLWAGGAGVDETSGVLWAHEMVCGDESRSQGQGPKLQVGNCGQD